MSRKHWCGMLVFTIMISGCTFVPVPIPVPVATEIKKEAASSAINQANNRYTIDEQQTDPRLEPLIIEGIQDEQSNFVLHVVLQPKEKITTAGVEVSCFGSLDEVLCSDSFLANLHPDGNLVVYGKTDVAYADVKWFRVNWSVFSTSSTLPAQSQSSHALETNAAQNSALPASQQADPSLAIGTRIRVRPGLRISLVAKPGADGAVVAYMQDQQEATIVGGPILTQGSRDTIVWWRIRLDNGTEAWAPANTSDVPVLERVP